MDGAPTLGRVGANDFISLQEELTAVHHWLRLVNQKYNNHIHWKNQLTEANEIMIMPGALLTALDSVVRGTLISSDSPLLLELESEEEYFVLRHGLNDRLQLHEASRNAFQQIQRSYSLYSDRPFIQVKAGRENYIKFPRISIASSEAV